LKNQKGKNAMITHRFLIPNIGIKTNRVGFVMTAYLEALDVENCYFHFSNLDPAIIHQCYEIGEFKSKSFSLSDKACLTLSKLHAKNPECTLQSLIIDVLNMIELDVSFKWNFRYCFM
jgi:hypothetical protein